MSRETRLLAATIAVSLAVLLVLSRFRFPATAPAGGDATAQPLARLAARAVFDDLSLAIRELTQRVEGSLLVVRLRPASTSGVPAPLSNLAVGQAGPATQERFAAALRVRDDLALVAAHPSVTVDAIVGTSGTPTIVGRDPIRGLLLVRVPAAPAPVLNVRDGAQPLGAPGYIAVAEASRSGPSLRPVYVGRSEPTSDPRWSGGAFTTGRSTMSDAGAPVFTLDGRLAGILMSTDVEPVLVPAQAVLAVVDTLLRGGMPPVGDLGVTAQPLDEALRAATGATQGAAIVAVDPDGPAAALEPGDVVTAVDTEPVATAAALLVRVARTAPGTTLSLSVRRGGRTETVRTVVRAAPSAAPAQATPASAQSPPTLGVVLRRVDGSGSVVARITPGSRADDAGLRVGDVVIAMGQQRTPTSEQIADAFAALAQGGTLFLSIERDGEPRLVVLRR
ncbi:MAG TPA: PDZ domain-containing protein [Luteitalea sp.]|nr:PDZ domain-containing protein [Luteitalea sp.]